MITVSLSIIILVSSLIQYSSQYALTAEQHHRSALEINELRRKIELSDPAKFDFNALHEVTSQYNSVLHKYSINHDNIDNAMAMLERAHENPWLGDWWKLKTRLHAFVINWLPLIALWASTAGMIYLSYIAVFKPSDLCLAVAASVH